MGRGGSGKVRLISSLEWNGFRLLRMSHGRKYPQLTGSTPTTEMNVQPRANTTEVNNMPELVPLCIYYGAFFIRVVAEIYIP